MADTTELTFNGQDIEGGGPLSYEAQVGMYLHATYAVTLDREALGVMNAWMWAREPRDDVAQDQLKPVVPAHGATDDDRGEAMAAIKRFGVLHRQILPDSVSNVTMP
ncbi:hypothetical protein SAMN05192539_10696 [Paraburkholderia diazotrophica]|uniref:Uncharacterized protein n=1 Tax=Paraburkholderia diazotrophica TaxID=667676 RepID=A0A1H7ERV1_9BURK|nr:hypothetical protein SAMN05192539_10696 [Paraburkholderia diazotrophica]